MPTPVTNLGDQAFDPDDPRWYSGNMGSMTINPKMSKSEWIKFQQEHGNPHMSYMVGPSQGYKQYNQAWRNNSFTAYDKALYFGLGDPSTMTPGDSGYHFQESDSGIYKAGTYANPMAWGYEGGDAYQSIPGLNIPYVAPRPLPSSGFVNPDGTPMDEGYLVGPENASPTIGTGHVEPTINPAGTIQGQLGREPLGAYVPPPAYDVAYNPPARGDIPTMEERTPYESKWGEFDYAAWDPDAIEFNATKVSSPTEEYQAFDQALKQRSALTGFDVSETQQKAGYGAILDAKTKEAVEIARIDAQRQREERKQAFLEYTTGWQQEFKVFAEEEGFNERSYQFETQQDFNEFKVGVDNFWKGVEDEKDTYNTQWGVGYADYTSLRDMGEQVYMEKLGHDFALEIQQTGYTINKLLALDQHDFDVVLKTMSIDAAEKLVALQSGAQFDQYAGALFNKPFDELTIEEKKAVIWYIKEHGIGSGKSGGGGDDTPFRFNINLGSDE